jgi:hypothetical protein
LLAAVAEPGMEAVTSSRQAIAAAKRGKTVLGLRLARIEILPTGMSGHLLRGDHLTRFGRWE